ncbi:MAG: hypothetical protein JJW01_00255 [Alphaproteobacteria bacterium]|nr:hypothetical protein [Rickettsiales bacterium]
MFVFSVPVSFIIGVLVLTLPNISHADDYLPIDPTVVPSKVAEGTVVAAGDHNVGTTSSVLRRNNDNSQSSTAFVAREIKRDNKKKQRAQARYESKKVQMLYHDGFTRKQDKGTTYLRLGGGGGSNNGLSVALWDVDSTDGSTDFSKSFSGGFSGLFNTELGFNSYSTGLLYMGMGIGVDMHFGNYNQDFITTGSFESFGSTAINAFLFEAKGKIGFHLDSGSSRTTFYLLAGAATQLSGVSGDTPRINAGPLTGLGFTIGSKRHPISFYCELTVPVLLRTLSADRTFTVTTTDPSNPNNNLVTDVTISLPEVSVTIAPKFAVGVQIGY